MTDKAQGLKNALGQNVPLSDGLGFDKEKINKMKTCSYLLPEPAGEVVRECLDEIERLRAILDDCRDMADYTNAGSNISAAIDKFMKR